MQLSTRSQITRLLRITRPKFDRIIIRLPRLLLPSTVSTLLRRAQVLSQNTYNASIIHPATTAVATEEVWLNQQIHPLLRPARPTPNTTANTAHTLSKVICRTAILNTPPAAPCTHNLDPTGLVMPEDNTPCTADIRSVEPRHLPLQPLLERVLVKFTRSSPFLVLNNTSVHAEDTRKSSACTSAAGTVAKRPTAH